MKPENACTKKKHSRIFQLALKDVLKSRQAKSSSLEKEQEKACQNNVKSSEKENVPEKEKNTFKIAISSGINRNSSENPDLKCYPEDQTDSDLFKLPLSSSKEKKMKETDLFSSNNANFCSPLDVGAKCDIHDSTSDLEDYLRSKSESNCQKLAINDKLSKQQSSPLEDFALPIMLKTDNRDLYYSSITVPNSIIESTMSNLHSDCNNLSSFSDPILNFSPTFSSNLNLGRSVISSLGKEKSASTGNTSESYDTSSIISEHDAALSLNFKTQCGSVFHFGSMQSLDSVLSEKSGSDENVHSNTSSGFFEMPCTFNGLEVKKSAVSRSISSGVESTSQSASENDDFGLEKHFKDLPCTFNGLEGRKSAVSRSISSGVESTSQSVSENDDFGLEKHFEDLLEFNNYTLANEVFYKSLEGAYNSSQTLSEECFLHDTKIPGSESSLPRKRPGESFAPLNRSVSLCNSETDSETKSCSIRHSVDDEVINLEKHFECLFKF